MNHFTHTFIHYFYEVIPAVILGFLISGIIHEIIPTKLIEKYLGRKGIAPIAWATLVGTFLPVCCWGSLPIALSLYKKGSKIGPVLAFLIATPATSISALFVSLRLLGFGFTIYIFFSVIIMGVLIGMGANLFKNIKGKITDDACPRCHETVVKCEYEHGVTNKIKDIFKYAFIEMPREIGLEILIGLVLAAIVSAFLPIGEIIHNYLSGFWAYPFSVITGLIMYFCSTASVPLIDALIKQGMNVGAAFVLLLVGPITSYGTILVLRKEFGIKILLYYLISICFLATILGIIYERFFV